MVRGQGVSGGRGGVAGTLRGQESKAELRGEVTSRHRQLVSDNLLGQVQTSEAGASAHCLCQPSAIG